MAYSDYKSIDQVQRDYPVKFRTASFLPDVRLDVPEWFRDNLTFVLEKQGARETEGFLREGFIFPFLQLAWRRHGHLKLWSHQALDYDDKLNGEPDYLVSAWIEEGMDKLVTRPFLAVSEAKRDDFDGGWAQCLAEQVACRKLNEDDGLTIYGIVSTGQVWQFGKLEGDVFTRHPVAFSIADMDRLLGILDFVFSECEKQLAAGT
jgi:hypothetical protein